MPTRWPSFPAVLTCFHVFATVWREVVTTAVVKLGAWFLDTFQVRRCWKKIDSAVNLVKTPARSSCSVCCGSYDWRRPLSRSAVLFATLWHYQGLSDERHAHHNQFEFWLLRRLTPAVIDHSPPILRRQQSVPSFVVYYAVVSMRLLRIFLATFSVLYYVTDSFFHIVPLSIFRDNVLSHN